MRDRDATMPKIDCAIVLRHIDLEGTVLRYSRFQCSVAMWIAPGALDPTRRRRCDPPGPGAVMPCKWSRESASE